MLFLTTKIYCKLTIYLCISLKLILNHVQKGMRPCGTNHYVYILLYYNMYKLFNQHSWNHAYNYLKIKLYYCTFISTCTLDKVAYSITIVYIWIYNFISYTWGVAAYIIRRTNLCCCDVETRLFSFQVCFCCLMVNSRINDCRYRCVYIIIVFAAPHGTVVGQLAHAYLFHFYFFPYSSFFICRLPVFHSWSHPQVWGTTPVHEYWTEWD